MLFFVWWSWMVVVSTNDANMDSGSIKSILFIKATSLIYLFIASSLRDITTPTVPASFTIAGGEDHLTRSHRFFNGYRYLLEVGERKENCETLVGSRM
jgi:hypothetical protein